MDCSATGIITGATKNLTIKQKLEIASFSLIFVTRSNSATVARGSIVTVPTTLCETHEWFGEWSLKALSVDCEVGYIAKAAAELDITFGFLNIISDNLYQTGGEDLSNEDSHTVITKRERLYKEITKIINSFLSADN